LALSGRTWLAERTAATQERLMAARTRIVEAYAGAAEAEYAARCRLLAAQRRFTEAAQPTPPPASVEQLLAVSQAMLQRQDEIERLLRAQSTLPTAPPPAALPPAPPQGAPALETHLTDRQIEVLALRAVSRFAALEPSKAEQEWAHWRGEVERRFPPYAAAEVVRRAAELRTLIR
jgi:hypothetical protein